MSCIDRMKTQHYLDEILSFQQPWQRPTYHFGMPTQQAQPCWLFIAILHSVELDLQSYFSVRLSHLKVTPVFSEAYRSRSFFRLSLWLVDEIFDPLAQELEVTQISRQTRLLLPRVMVFWDRWVFDFLGWAYRSDRGTSCICFRPRSSDIRGPIYQCSRT